jgi:hypothetical protein
VSLLASTSMQYNVMFGRMIQTPVFVSLCSTKQYGMFMAVYGAVRNSRIDAY